MWRGEKNDPGDLAKKQSEICYFREVWKRTYQELRSNYGREI